MSKESSWAQRLRIASEYLRDGDLDGLAAEVRRFWAWKKLKPITQQAGAGLQALAGSAPPKRKQVQNLDPFVAFLKFEQDVFGKDQLIAHYDPFLIRYGEYRFTLDMLPFRPGETILDMGCESNILILFLAYMGCNMIGVDLDPQVWEELKTRKEMVERATDQQLAVTFRAEDATQLSLEPASVDKVVAISSIEHMFSERGDGDQLAMASVAQVLKPGGLVALSLPMSNGAPFHEAPKGDERFDTPYRLYTPQAVAERILSQPGLETVHLAYLAQTTPDPRFSQLRFYRFWMDTLTAQERLKWAWANPILAEVFNPVISQDEGERRLETVNTVLICLRKN